MYTATIRTFLFSPPSQAHPPFELAREICRQRLCPNGVPEANRRREHTLTPVSLGSARKLCAFCRASRLLGRSVGQGDTHTHPHTMAPEMTTAPRRRALLVPRVWMVAPGQIDNNHDTRPYCMVVSCLLTCRAYSSSGKMLGPLLSFLCLPPLWIVCVCVCLCVCLCVCVCINISIYVYMYMLLGPPGQRGMPDEGLRGGFRIGPRTRSN